MNKRNRCQLFLSFIILVHSAFAQQLADTVLLKEAEVTESKIAKNILESPATIIKLSSKNINELPNENFYSGLASVKGIDVSTNSLFYQNINMRGPSNPMSESVLQLTDGMDNTPPGQGFSVGNLAGINDIDIESIEILPGSSSAIHGANAFSGLILMNTKSPFTFRGLSAQFKNGVTYIDGKYHLPAFYSDYQVRYADAWKDKLGFKFVIGYQQGTDWMNLDQTDWNITTPPDQRGLDNPARDIFNIYGDETLETLTLGADSNAVDVSRSGYNANDMLGLKTNDLKLSTSVYYKLNKKTELSYLFAYSLFNTDVHPWAWNFRDFAVMYNKLELKSKNYFIRFYTINDHDGHSYQSDYAANYILSQWKSDSAWFSEYENAYNGRIDGVSSNNHNTARNYADTGMPQPGSDLFNQLLSESVDVPLNLENGSRYMDRTNLQHIHAQYDFSDKLKWMKIITGVEARSRNLWSNGTMFLDYPPAHYINTKSLGAYAQLSKDFFHERLNVLASIRYDKYDVFEATLTPRVMFMYKLNENNYFRASYQTGSRTPDPYDEYRDDHYGIFHSVGGLALSDEKYGIHHRGFELQSFMDYLTRANAYLDEYGVDSTDAAVNLYKGLLKPVQLEYVHAEKVQTIEVGYQFLVFDKRLHFDIDFFGSIYKGLISYKWAVIAEEGNPYSDDSLTAAAAAMLDGGGFGRTNGYNVPFNLEPTVRSGGVEASMEFNFYRNYILSGNFIYQTSSEIDLETGVNVWLFQIAPLKTNVSLSNPNCFKNVGFSINWHWTDALTGYWDFVNPALTNNSIPANSVIDAQVSLAVPKIKSSIKLGASNLLNHYYQNVAYGASIGSVYYVSIAYNVN